MRKVLAAFLLAGCASTTAQPPIEISSYPFDFDENVHRAEAKVAAGEDLTAADREVLGELAEIKANCRLVAEQVKSDGMVTARQVARAWTDAALWGYCDPLPAVRLSRRELAELCLRVAQVARAGRFKEPMTEETLVNARDWTFIFQNQVRAEPVCS